MGSEKRQKKRLRRQMLEVRDSMTRDEIINKSLDVQNRLMRTIQYAQCETLFIYINMGSEVITSAIITDALGKNKNVAAPVCNFDTRVMNFIKISPEENLFINKLGVPEPIFDKKRIIKSDEKTLIIAPGLLFSRDRYRLGYGGGYYDRYLSANKTLACIGICYDFQLVDFVPTQTCDVPVNIIITESGEFM